MAKSRYEVVKDQIKFQKNNEYCFFPPGGSLPMLIGNTMTTNSKKEAITEAMSIKKDEKEKFAYLAGVLICGFNSANDRYQFLKENNLLKPVQEFMEKAPDITMEFFNDKTAFEMSDLKKALLSNNLKELDNKIEDCKKGAESLSKIMKKPAKTKEELDKNQKETRVPEKNLNEKCEKFAKINKKCVLDYQGSDAKFEYSTIIDSMINIKSKIIELRNPDPKSKNVDDNTFNVFSDLYGNFIDEAKKLDSTMDKKNLLKKFKAEFEPKFDTLVRLSKTKEDGRNWSEYFEQLMDTLWSWVGQDINTILNKNLEQTLTGAIDTAKKKFASKLEAQRENEMETGVGK